MDSSAFVGKLYAWHKNIDRQLPWKEDADGYKTWVSEVIMQQTRIEQGTPYYLRFVNKWPDALSLAQAPEDEVFKMWEGLGYYSRARNMHAAAKQIVAFHGGQFPNEYDDIIRLKGVGPYTAAAISSFAFGHIYPVMDGNVMRVISRIYGVALPIDTLEGKREMQRILESLIDQKKPGKFNQAMMDFGALACKPSNPDCEHCNFVEECIAFKAGLVNTLPIKSKKIGKKTRYFHYLLMTNNDQIAIQKRGAGDIWQGLYELPLIEKIDEEFGISEIVQFFKENKFADLSQLKITQTTKLKKHLLTHLVIEAFVHEIEGNFELFSNNRPYFFVSYKNLDNFAFPKLLLRFLTDTGLINR